MSAITWKTFTHPHGVYHLEQPAHWDQITEKDGESCGFGPHERDDVGLWISILPMSVDTDRLAEDLPKIMTQALDQFEARNLRKDDSLRHYGLTAEVVKEGEGGNYWIVTGGDVILFASSQVPAAEKEAWNPLFQRVMASLQITREYELFRRKVANDLLERLQTKYPDQEFAFDGNKIRGKFSVVYLNNITREIRASPSRREKILQRFVATLGKPADANLGQETWEEARTRIVPVLKPCDYITAEGPTQHILTTEWLADVLICYAIRSKKMYRFVTGWDVNRWETDAQTLHDLAIANLAKLPWPQKLLGSRDPSSNGRVVVVDTDDSLATSRLLHPDLYQMFSGPLGSPFWAGIPSRDTLVLYSDRRELKQRIGRRLMKDYKASAYAITSQPFLVTRDGIAAPPTK